MGVTGVRGEITTDLSSIVAEIRKHTDIPVAVGFGISTPHQVKQYSAVADGVIVGSAIVRLIGQHGTDAKRYVYEYIKSLVES